MEFWPWLNYKQFLSVKNFVQMMAKGMSAPSFQSFLKFEKILWGKRASTYLIKTGQHSEWTVHFLEWYEHWSIIYHKELCAVALTTDGYLQNKMSTKGLSSDCTPYKLWFASELDVNHLRTFEASAGIMPRKIFQGSLMTKLGPQFSLIMLKTKTHIHCGT